jgi:hypothetical protein
MAEQNIAAKGVSEVPGVSATATAEAFPVFTLPPRVSGKTTGIIEFEGVSGNVRLVSGNYQGPSQYLLTMEGMNARAVEKVLTKRGAMVGNVIDVEVQAAVQMRLLGVREATLRINHTAVCSRCMSNVADILQQGQKLTVIDASGKATEFIGRGTWH